MLGDRVDYEHDLLGRVIRKNVAGEITTYAYDARGRRSRRVTPTGRLTTYGYDDADRLAHLTTDGHRIAFGYDANGRERRVPSVTW